MKRPWRSGLWVAAAANWSETHPPPPSLRRLTSARAAADALVRARSRSAQHHQGNVIGMDSIIGGTSSPEEEEEGQ